MPLFNDIMWKLKKHLDDEKLNRNKDMINIRNELDSKFGINKNGALSKFIAIKLTEKRL